MDNILISNHPLKKRKFRFSSLAFVTLLFYIATNVLGYIEFIPTTLISLSLYGFVALSVVTIAIYKKPKFSEKYIWFVVFVGLCGFSCIYSVSRSASLTATFSMAKVLVFSFMMYNIVDCKERLEKVLMTNSISTTFLILYLIYTGELFVKDERLGNTLMGNANILATLLMFAAFSSVYFVSFSEKRLGKVIFAASFLLQLFALSLTGSRKFFILPLLLLCSMIVLNSPKRKNRHFIFKFIVAIIVFAGVFWLIFNVDFFYNYIGYRMETLFNFLRGEGEVDASTLVRQVLIDQAIALWKQSPIIGNGLDTFKIMSSYGVYSHNNYVELLCNLGIVGVVVYYSYFLYLIIKISKIKTRNSIKWYWFIIVVCMAIFDVGGVSYNIFQIHIMLVLVDLYVKKPEEFTTEKVFLNAAKRRRRNEFN